MLPREEMLAASRQRDRSYDGLFYIAVTTTGMFCRAVVPGAGPQTGARRVLRHRARGARGGLPAVQAVPAARPGGRHAGVGGAAHRPRRGRPGGARHGRRPARRGPGPGGRAPLVPEDARHDLPGLLPRPPAGRRVRRAPRRATRSTRSCSTTAGARTPASATAFGKLAGAPPGAAAAAPDGSLIRLAWLETPSARWSPARRDDALCLLEYPDRRMMETQLDTLRRRFARPLAPGASPLFAPLRAQLDEYFAGRRRAFDLPLEYPGAPSSAASGTRCGASPTARPAPTPSSPARSARRARRAPSAPPTAPTASPSSSRATGWSPPTAASAATAAASGASCVCSSSRAAGPEPAGGPACAWGGSRLSCAIIMPSVS